ncbi:hypothetical protein [Gynurincola endophyticus]|uniref:hypothetical protein n=1 Tax=Gynurincola endophyticus TaxID=2479004 RepID=UPI000F8E317F|nr:hypothetical protein [Gynurincola endophyticus]
MKYLIFAILILVSTNIYSQEKTTSDKSKIQNFSLKTGSMIQKEFFPLGSVKKISIDKLVLTDVLTKVKLTGVKIKTSVVKSYSTSESSCFLDLDEIEEIIKSSNFVLKMDAPGEIYTEFQFTSKEGFKAGSFSSKGEWAYFIQLDKYSNDSLVFMSKGEFEQFIAVLKSVK